MNVQGSVLTFDAIKQKYPLDKYIMVRPQVSRHLLTAVPMWSLDVATIKFDPHNKNHVFTPKGSSDLALKKYALDQLAAAADASVMAKRIDDRSNRMYAEFEATAVMTTPSGGQCGQARTCEWDGEIAKQEVYQQAVAYIRKQIKDWTNKPAEEKFNSMVKERSEGQWIREQKHGKRKAESGAGNRAIRSLLGLQAGYSRDEIRDKEFAVVRFLFTPDMGDRDIKLLVVSASLQARRMLYPAPAAEPLALEAGVVEEQPAADDNDQYSEPEPDPIEQEADLTWNQVSGYIPDLVVAVSRAKDALRERLSARLSQSIAEQNPGKIAQLVDICETSGLMEDTK